jgi:site-specific DNA-methyltransferase (adenine-specific)
LEYNKIYHGDSLEILKAFPSNSVDCIITSPPYNLDINYDGYKDNKNYIDYLEFTRKYLKLLFHVLKEDGGGRLCLNIPIDANKFGRESIYSDILQIAKEVGFKYNTTIMWNKNSISKRTAWGSWMSSSAPCIICPLEVILVLYKNNWKKKNKGKSTVSRNEFMNWTNGMWTIRPASSKKIGHPAPFPDELVERCIKMFTYEDDTILDPFCGSGTTCFNAKILNRKWIGIEINKDYIQLATQRINSVLENYIDI